MGGLPLAGPFMFSAVIVRRVLLHSIGSRIGEVVLCFAVNYLVIMLYLEMGRVMVYPVCNSEKSCMDSAPFF